MAETHQDGNPYKTNVTKTFALSVFSRAHFKSKLHGVFCVWSQIDIGEIIFNKIVNMVSQKNRKIAKHFGKFQHFWKIAKKAILYRKFLHENSIYRTNGVYHNVANRKCNKTVNSEFWFLKLCHRDFFTESLSFFQKLKKLKNLKNGLL